MSELGNVLTPSAIQMLSALMDKTQTQGMNTLPSPKPPPQFRAPGRHYLEQRIMSGELGFEPPLALGHIKDWMNLPMRFKPVAEQALSPLKNTAMGLSDDVVGEALPISRDALVRSKLGDLADRMFGIEFKIPKEVREVLKQHDTLGFDSTGEAASAILTHFDFARRWDIESKIARDVLKRWREKTLREVPALRRGEVRTRENILRGYGIGEG